jgi:[ribosomal protein S5]-alanine N-acetyltransferase
VAETFVLALPEEQHLDGLDKLLNDPDVSSWLGGPRTREAILGTIQGERRHWEQYGFGPWVVLDRVSKEVIGRGGLRCAEVRGRAEVELFYAVTPCLWGRGIATAMANFSVEVGFHKVALPSIVAFTTQVNRASLRVIERLHFTREAVFEHANLPHVLFRLTKAEFERNHTGSNPECMSFPVMR